MEVCSVLWNTLLLGLALIPMGAYRWYVGRHAEILLGMRYFLNWDRALGSVMCIVSLLPLGTFEAFKLFWIFPVIALAAYIEQRRWVDLVSMSAVILCTMSQLLVANDTSRLVGLAFPAVVLGALEARRAWGPDRFARKLWLLILLNFLVPELYVGQNTPVPLLSVPYTCAIHLLHLLH